MLFRRRIPFPLALLWIAIASGVLLFFVWNITSLPDAFLPFSGEVDVPILAYHIVRPSYPSDDRSVRALAQTPEVFDAQMKYLAVAGYHVISFADLEKYFKNGTRLPPHPIILSFDDGWSNQFQYAFPILEKYHYTATFFVYTNPIGTKGFLTWDNLRELIAAGMTIGSHSRSHPYLTQIQDKAVLWDEIYGSKRTLERNLGTTVHEFAYPFGQYNATVMDLVQKAGYIAARGDYFYDGKQYVSMPFELDGLNVPTTMALFIKKFPLN